MTAIYGCPHAAASCAQQQMALDTRLAVYKLTTLIITLRLPLDPREALPIIAYWHISSFSVLYVTICCNCQAVTRLS